MFFLEDRRKKPERWELEKGLTEPEWEWFWTDLEWFLPMWSGPAPYDVIQRDFLTLQSGTPTLQPRRAGLGFSFDGIDDYFTHPDLSLSRLLAKHTITVFLNTISTGKERSVWGTFNNDTTVGIDFALNVDSAGALDGNKIRYFLRDDAGSAMGAATTNDTKVVWNDGADHAITCILDKAKGSSGGLQILVDGISEAISYDSSGTGINFATDFDFVAAVGSRNNRGSFQQEFLGHMYYLAIHSGVKAPSEIKDLHTDPLGPLRRRKEAAFFVPVAVAAAASKPPSGLALLGVGT